jgi:hypothetical protein
MFYCAEREYIGRYIQVLLSSYLAPPPPRSPVSTDRQGLPLFRGKKELGWQFRCDPHSSRQMGGRVLKQIRRQQNCIPLYSFYESYSTDRTTLLKYFN